MKKSILTLLALFAAIAVDAQNAQVLNNLPHKVDNIEMVDLRNEPTKIPHYGEKNLLIFYIDPDKHKQNEDFTNEMEEKHLASGPNIEGFGVINLKDTMFPNGIVRSMARKRTEKNGATVSADPDRRLAKRWGLGDCNNMFVLLVVSKEGELVFCKKGELSKADQKEFYDFIQDYR